MKIPELFDKQFKKLIYYHNKHVAKRYIIDNTLEFRELDEIIKLSCERSDINDHLTTLFLESVSLRPKLIVELGVRKGVSTFVFERVASLFNSILVSIDIMECSTVSNYKNWFFIQEDDIVFGNEFQMWCKNRGFDHNIDILFIDTSHLLDHTLAELNTYIPLLSKHAKVFLHDTNIDGYYFRKDYSIGKGWDNNRGVIRALEIYFNKDFNEKADFIDFISPFLIKHHHICCGLTMLEKLPFV
jgi:cephalosporin hydroxylase